MNPGKWLSVFRAFGNRVVIRWRARLCERRCRRQGLRQVRQMNRRVRQNGQAVETLVRERDPDVFSVAIPAWHAEDFMEETLGTVVSQEMPDGVTLDVVVAVDGCAATRDAVLAAMRRMDSAHRKYVRMLMHEKNYGSYIMQNTALHAARGDLVHIMGADDGLAPGALRNLWRFAGECRRCSPEFILQPMAMICDGRLKPRADRAPNQQKGALILTKGVLEKLGGFAPWMCAADSDFLRRAERKSIPVFSLPEVTYWYRHHGRQLTHGAGTGMRSGVREAYWRETNDRILSGLVFEPPVIAPDGICTDGNAVGDQTP